MSALQATVAQCRFTTARLEVANWHDEMTSISGSDDHTATGQPAVVRETLTQWVVALLSDEQTTGKLPPPWQGPYDNARAAQWMADRDREGTVLLAAERDTGDNVGLVILGVDGREVRLGYVLAECKWGKGFGSELVQGLVGWCREHTAGIADAIVAGVACDNVASVRVLEKAGFTRNTAVSNPDTDGRGDEHEGNDHCGDDDAELFFRIDFSPRQHPLGSGPALEAEPSIASLLHCPLCDTAVGSDMVCARCGSLEGLVDPSSSGAASVMQSLDASADATWIAQCRSAAVRPAGRLYGFDWAAGEVAPFVPAPVDAIDAGLRLCGVGPGVSVVDLGSGDGRVVIAAAKLGAAATGVELDPKLCAAGCAAAREAGLPVVHAPTHTVSVSDSIGTGEDKRRSIPVEPRADAVMNHGSHPHGAHPDAPCSTGQNGGSCTFIEADLTTMDLAPYSIVTAFLLPPTL